MIALHENVQAQKSTDAMARGTALVTIGYAGIELAAHPTNPTALRHRRATPNGWTADLPAGLAAMLRSHKPWLLDLLAGSHAPRDDPEAAYTLAERLGIADDLEMPTHPGSPAWLVAVGESLNAGCQVATTSVHSGHGPTRSSHRGCDPGQRSDAGSDRQGGGRGP